MKKLIIGTILSAIALVGNAADIQATMNATANVENSCLVKANNVEFGEISINWNVEHPEFIKTIANPGTILCTIGTPYTLSLSDGKSNTPGERFMLNENGEDKLLYNVYVAPNGNPNLFQTRSNIGTGNSVLFGMNFRIYSILKGQTLVAAGNYSDQLELKVDY